MGLHVFEYYLALLQVQMAILGLVVAGLVTLMQMLNTAVPKRKLKLLAQPGELVGFVAFLSVLVATLAIATWATAFAAKDSPIMVIFENKLTGIMLLLLCLVGLGWFTTFIYRTRHLLDSRLYLRQYVRRLASRDVLEYIEKMYASKSAGLETSITNDKLYDPFQPIREYIKHNAQQQYDYGTAAGLRLFGILFDKAFRGVEKTQKTSSYSLLANYLAVSGVEFFRVFHKSSSEKRRLDVIRMIQEKGYRFLEVHDDKSVVILIRALEEMGRMSTDEHEIVVVIQKVQELTDAYLMLHEHAPWSETGDDFEEICLSVARLAEGYYLESDRPLRSVPLISYYTGKTKSVGMVLVNFFAKYQHMANVSAKVYPKTYFEAIEAVCEALYARVRAIHDTGKTAVGLNGNYHVLTSKLYVIYKDFAQEAARHAQPELFALSMSNLRRIVKSANRFGLNDEREALALLIAELTVLGASQMGEAPIKNGLTAMEYGAETLKKHAWREDNDRALHMLRGKADDAQLDDLARRLHF